ncbi:MAG: LacI family DNA-binding transcriptional regulator [Peptoniphilaceae bacterium]|nr:LacI family DNA-binding transcriptional regulator [Peptoniphilaceae bacterium]
MVSMRDIAKITGLSIATISRYMNHSGYVSEEASLRIQKALEETDYIPNRNAHALLTKRSGTIGLLVPSLVNPYFAYMATRIGNRIQKDQRGCILGFTEDNAKKEKRAMEMFMGYRVDGIIIVRAVEPTLWQALDVPIVSFESHIGPQIITVTADNVRGGRQAFRHLLEKGCRRFIHVRGPRWFTALAERETGFVEAATEAGKEVLFIQLEGDYQVDVSLDERRIDFSFQRGDGVFVFNDVNALSVMQAIKSQGLSVPEDVKVMGFDNNIASQFYNPSLTTVDQKVVETSNLCYELLDQLIADPSLDKRTRVVPVDLLERHSTAGVFA